MSASLDTATMHIESTDNADHGDNHDPCDKTRDDTDGSFRENVGATVPDGGNGHAPVDAGDPHPGVDIGSAAAAATHDDGDDDYDGTGASYASLFAVGGLFSEFVADHDEDFWDSTDTMMMMGASTSLVATDQGPGGGAAAATWGLPFASVVDAVDALLATCPRLAECKPATLALPRAPMVYVIKRHMRDHGGVDFGPAAGGLCATLHEACKRVDGLGPCKMLDRGVVAWVTGRLMDHVRPGSSHGIPVTPLSHIGSHVRRHFGHDRWVLEDPEALDLCMEQPEHAPLRALIAWIVDSARTVAVLRARTASDGTATRQPYGKDYTNGPIKCLAKERDAHLRREATDSASWETFLREQASADKARPTTTTKKRRRLARTHPEPTAGASPATTGAATTNDAPLATRKKKKRRSTASATSGTATAAGPGRAALASSLPSVASTAPSVAAFVPPVLPSAPPAPTPTALDVTTLDRHILAQIQSFALMSLAAAGPAGIASDAPITFMAPSVSCPGTMAFTCWVTVPSSDPVAAAAATAPKVRTRGERSRKRAKRARKTSSRRDRTDGSAAAAAVVAQDASRVGADDAGGAAAPTAVPAGTLSDKHDTADATATADQPQSPIVEPATQPTARRDMASPSTLTSPFDEMPARAPVDAPADDETGRGDRGADLMETTIVATGDATASAVASDSDETIDQGFAQPRKEPPTCAVQTCTTAPASATAAANVALADRAYDLDQLLCGDGEDDWDTLLACGQLPPA
ncbi:DamX incomplete domain containing protein [Pandoravirus salinus]|uniref:DamX incomplete domain containing protein n=1 Tax=Pandoravirus salinus TaxID=1349410 RepID=S4VY50_9VIRU|nr:DamX superfamily incomplete domain [Pandoravirus salinus]AGO85604.1 DamX incomplete domain containing protein [Pandoravirus salinus]